MLGTYDAPPALRDLAHRYAHAVDTRDAAAICAVFTTQGGISGWSDNPVQYLGNERLTQMMVDMESFERTMHKVYNQLFARDAAGAVTGLTYCTASHLLKGEEATLLDMEILYHDSYAEQDGEWRFAHRVLEVLWVETRSVTRFTPAVMSGSLEAFR